MTQREKEILTILKKEPMISQQDLADRLGITRSSAAVYITHLLQKGYLLGKGYIIQEDPYVLVIGGSNIDIQGVPDSTMIARDSNIGKVHISLGGVGRNIAENCARLGISTRLISVVGDDPYGKQILEHANTLNLDMSDALVLKGQSTSMYLSILDETNDMALAINAMDSIKSLTPEYILKKKHVLDHASLIVLDTNLETNVIETILRLAKCPIYIDPVSTTKAKKITHLLHRIHGLKPNRLEAEVLSGVSMDHPENVAQILHQKGIEELFISLGKEGVYVSQNGKGYKVPNPPTHVVNATGAGDAFMAALIYAKMKQLSLEDTVKTALSASALCLESTETIHPELCEEKLMEKRKELYP